MLQLGISLLSPRETGKKQGGFDQLEGQKEEAGDEVDHFTKSAVGIPTNLDTFTVAESCLRGDHHISNYLLSRKS